MTDGIFIIESLTLENEKKQLRDGEVLYDYCRKLLGEKTKYYYIRTGCELKEMSKIFKRSPCEYLYLSCHGKDNGLSTTFENVTTEEFSSYFEDRLGGCRMLVSACSLGDKKFAEKIFSKNENLLSFTAPLNEVTFDQMFSFWSTFFYLVNQDDVDITDEKKIVDILRVCANIFKVNMRHFTYDDSKCSLKRITYIGDAWDRIIEAIKTPS